MLSFYLPSVIYVDCIMQLGCNFVIEFVGSLGLFINLCVCCSFWICRHCLRCTIFDFLAMTGFFIVGFLVFSCVMLIDFFSN